MAKMKTGRTTFTTTPPPTLVIIKSISLTRLTMKD
jgi:hypothetical protein